MSYFSNNIKYLRGNKNQSEMGKILNVNQTTIARWEDGETLPSIDKGLEISERFNIPLPQLFGKDLRIEQNEDLQQWEKEMSELDKVLFKTTDNLKKDIDKYSDRDKKMIINFINSLDEEIDNEFNNNGD